MLRSLRTVKHVPASSRAARTALIRPTSLARPTHAASRPTLQNLQKLQRFSNSSYTACRNFNTSPAGMGVMHFKLPDIGEGIAEVEMLKWHVEVGQKVQHFDDLCEVQSDKSTAEISSPVDGIIKAINFTDGQMIQVGQVLCEIETEGEGTEESHVSDPAPAEEHVSEAAGTGLSHSPSDAGHTVPPRMQAEGGDRTVGAEVKRSEARSEEHIQDMEGEAKGSSSSEPSYQIDEAAEYSGGARFQGEASILPSAPSPTSRAEHITPVARREPEKRIERKVVLSSPAVRALARRLDVDLEYVKGSGEKGRIRKEDVEAYIKSRNASSSVESSQPIRRSVSDAERPKEPESTRVEFGRTRKVMWKALGMQGTVPHFGYSHTLNLTPLLPHLKALNPSPSATSSKSYLASDMPPSLSRDPLPASPAKTTLLTLFVKALLMALEEHPIMRSRVMSKEDQRWLEVRRDPIVGIAVSDPKHGLLTPSLPPLPPSTSVNQITSHLSALRAKPTTPSPPSSVVISSVGGLGESTGAMPVIPPGGPVAICAIGKAVWEIEWALKDAGTKVDPLDVERAGTKAVLRCPVGWSGDHRVLEGAELIAFTESWKRYIEEPWRWLRLDG